MSPVPEKFQAYGEAVCAFLSHATRREKAAVRQELMDHLTDHTQALLDAGCPPEAAETRALAAMGEAQEVGQALNQAFPRRWLVLSRLALAALGLLLTLVLLGYALPLGEHLQEAWAIRQDPLHNYHTTFLLGEEHTLEDVIPLEGQAYPLPDGSTLTDKDGFVYGGALTLELESYITDRVVLLMNARERCLFGSSVGKFHTQFGIGLKIIM